MANKINKNHFVFTARKLVTFLGNVHVLFGEVLDLVGVDPGLSGVLKALLQRIVLVDVLGGLEHNALVDGTGAGLEQLDPFQVILVDPSVRVCAESANEKDMFQK